MEHVPRRVSVVCSADVLPWLVTVMAPECVRRLLEAHILLLAVRYFVSSTNWTLGIPLLKVLLVHDFSDEKIINFLLCCQTLIVRKFTQPDRGLVVGLVVIGTV